MPKSKVPEFDRQLAGQEAGVNGMTVEEYLKGREAFKNNEVTRDPQVARLARDQHKQQLSDGIAERLIDEGMGIQQAEATAMALASDQMRTLAALHNPDLQSAGKDIIADFGDRNVNSRIGALWNAGSRSRLDELDDAARAIPEGARSATKMNANLRRCK